MKRSKSHRLNPVGQLALALMLGATLASTGCEEEIGDSCATNVDCASDGSRICDRSSPGGYCTIEGCNGGGCPEEAVCISFFPTQFLTVPCDPETEDIACEPCDPQGGDEGCNAYCDPESPFKVCQACDPEAEPDCNAYCDPAPPTDDCLPDELCLGTGMCARRDTERRFCMRMCSSDGDCRDAYECADTGTGGAERAPKPGQPYPRTPRGFCAPKR
jgi:hypothetical protein